jgi:polyhydroxybutyrate depolymerase
MRRLAPLLSALCLASLLAGANGAQAATHSVRSLTSGGESRSTVVFRPTTVSSAHPPLVIVLHGGGSSGAGMENVTQFDSVATSGGFVVAYPDAVNDPTTNTKLWRVGCCNAWRSAATDVSFVSDLIDSLAASESIDTSRVYIASFSIGSAMAYRLGCELSSRVAAFGSVGGYEYLSKPCAPDRPVSVYEIHGTADYYNGSCGGTTQTNAGCSFGQSGYTPSVQQTNQQWRDLDGCSGPASATNTVGTVTQQTWSGCAAGSSVRLDTIQNGPHCYPTATATNCGAFNASQSLWSFFSGHSLSPAPAPPADDPPAPPADDPPAPPADDPPAPPADDPPVVNPPAVTPPTVDPPATPAVPAPAVTVPAVTNPVTAVVARDLTRPVVSRVTLKARRLSLTVSEAATVEVTLSPRARRAGHGAAAHRLTIRLTAARAGTITRGLRRLAPGRYSVVVHVTDRAGNAATRTVALGV